MASKIFIVGATGNIGKELVSKTEFQIETQTSEIEYVHGEFETISSHPTIFEDVERIFFVTRASPSIAQLEKQAVELAVKTSKGLKQVIKLSSMGSSSDLEPNNFLKNLNESEKSVGKVLKNTSISYVVIRPNMFIQNFIRDDLASIKNDSVFYRPKHDTEFPYRISHVDTSDIAEFVAHILTQPPEQYPNDTFNLTGPQSLNYQEIAQIISTTLGKQVKCIELDEFEYCEKLKNSGVPPFLLIRFLKLFQVFKLKGATANVHGDYQLITGKRPRSVEEFFIRNKQLFL